MPLFLLLESALFQACGEICEPLQPLGLLGVKQADDVSDRQLLPRDHQGRSMGCLQGCWRLLWRRAAAAATNQLQSVLTYTQRTPKKTNNIKSTPPKCHVWPFRLFLSHIFANWCGCVMGWMQRMLRPFGHRFRFRNGIRNNRIVTISDLFSAECG